MRVKFPVDNSSPDDPKDLPQVLISFNFGKIYNKCD